MLLEVGETVTVWGHLSSRSRRRLGLVFSSRELLFIKVVFKIVFGVDVNGDMMILRTSWTTRRSRDEILFVADVARVKNLSTSWSHIYGWSDKNDGSLTATRCNIGVEVTYSSAIFQTRRRHQRRGLVEAERNLQLKLTNKSWLWHCWGCTENVFVTWQLFTLCAMVEDY